MFRLSRLAPVLLLLAACGAAPEDSPDLAVQARPMCRVDDFSCAPQEDDGEGGTLPLPSRRLTLELQNAAGAERVCQLTWSYSRADGTVASGALVSAELVPANGWRSGYLDVPFGRTVSVSAGCWHPGYPEVPLRAGTSVTTLPMDRPRWCRAIYSENQGPSMAIPCWY